MLYTCAMQPYQKRNRHFEALAERRGTVWMGQNTNHLPTHPAVKRAMIEAIEDEDYHAYAPPTGLEELRRLILEDFAVEDADVLITDGAVEGLYHACRHVLRPGQRMIATDPGWPWPEAFSRLSGAEVVALPIYRAEQGFKLTPGQLAEAVAAGGAGLIYLIDPLNPLGIGYPADEIEAFAGIAREAGAWLIHDCTYRHFAHTHTLAWRYYPEKTVTTYSFSKWLGLAGLRVGGLMARPSVIEMLSDGQPNSLGSNLVSQRGAIAGLRTRHEWFPEVNRIQRANQHAIHEAVRPINGLDMPVYPSNGNFVAIDVSAAGIAPETLCELYLEQGIMIRQAAYQSKLFADRFVKVSTTVKEEDAARFCALLPELTAAAIDRGRSGRALY
ncbi:MAG: pyridoxal phosphate-dependent aminotransferase [Defluviicoccus sp.]|nr:pyridoxal phosphate-dependent aminotransferase [Defluviicoccus sp.]